MFLSEQSEADALRVIQRQFAKVTIICSLTCKTLETVNLPSTNAIQDIFATGCWVGQVSCLVVAVFVYQNNWFIAAAQNRRDSF